MASTPDFVAYVLDQFDADCGVTEKKMFGEYGLFSAGKMFGMVCDDRLFIKKTEEGAAWAGPLKEAPPYPGAKPIFLVEDRIDDGAWLSELARITTRALPEPKARKRKKG